MDPLTASFDDWAEDFKEQERMKKELREKKRLNSIIVNKQNKCTYNMTEVVCFFLFLISFLFCITNVDNPINNQNYGDFMMP